jgi:hypothetical protein
MASVKKDAIGQEIRKSYERGGQKGCPEATTDIHVNLKNRNNAIKEYGYGPLNPESESRAFWDKKAELWGTTVREAKKARCGNCAAFIQTPKMMACITNGITASEEGEEHESYAEEVAGAANLGYCELFHFKCAGDRTCDAWLVGGPIT